MKTKHSVVVEFFRSLKARILRDGDQAREELFARLPDDDHEELLRHLDGEKVWGVVTRKEFEEEFAYRNVTADRSFAIALTREYLFLKQTLEVYQGAAPCFGKRILDIGCRNGIQSCFIARLCPSSTVLGIDVLPQGIPHARALAARLKEGNAEFREGSVRDLDPSERFDTIVLTRPMRRYGLGCSYYANYTSLLGEAEHEVADWAPLAEAVSKRLAEGGHLFVSDVCPYDAKLLGLLLAFADAGIRWLEPKSSRGCGMHVEEAAVSDLNQYDLVFVKESKGKVDRAGVVSDFVGAACCTEAKKGSGIYMNEHAAAMIHLHAGTLLAGFTATYEYENDDADGVASLAWRDREDGSVWLECQCRTMTGVMHWPAEREQFAVGEVWASARTAAEDDPDRFQVLSGSYDALDAENVVDYSTLPEGNLDSDEQETSGESPWSDRAADGQKGGGASAKGMIPRLSSSDFLKANIPSLVEKTGDNPLLSALGKDALSRRLTMAGIGGFRISRASKCNDPRRRKAKKDNPRKSTPSEEPKSAEPPVQPRPTQTMEQRLRLTFISKSGRLNVENMETGAQWRVDSSGVRIEDKDVGHVASRSIEDTDFTMTTSPDQIVLRDDSCGYEFTLRLG